MKTIQVKLEESEVEKLDKEAERLGHNRSSMARYMLKKELEKLEQGDEDEEGTA